MCLCKFQSSSTYPISSFLLHKSSSTFHIAINYDNDTDDHTDVICRYHV